MPIRPDAVVVIYNDHGLNFFLDKLPTFAVGAAIEYRHADEGWGLPISRPFRAIRLYPGTSSNRWLPTSSTSQAARRCWSITPSRSRWHCYGPGADQRPMRNVPIEINTVQHPLPSPARCFKFGQAIGRAINSYARDMKVLVVGTGGLSHQLDGTRAGFINKDFDLMCLEKLVHRARGSDPLLRSRSSSSWPGRRA